MRLLKIYLLIFITNLSYSQDENLESFFFHLKSKDFNSCIEMSNKVEDTLLKTLLYDLTLILKAKNPKPSLQDLNDLNNFESSIYHLIDGYNHTYSQNQENLKAYLSLNKSLKMGESLDIPYLQRASLIAILDLFKYEIFIGSKQYQYYLEEFEKIKEDKIDEAIYIMYVLTFSTKMDEDDNVNKAYYDNLSRLDSIFSLIPKSHSLFPFYIYEKGIECKIKGEYVKAKEKFNQSIKLISRDQSKTDLKSTIAWQMAHINYKEKNGDSAIYYLNQSKKISSKLRDSFYNDRLFSLIMADNKKFDSAYYYLEKSVQTEYSLGYKNNTLESSILSVQNETDKLKLNNLKIESKRKQDRNLLIITIVLMVFSLVIFYLIQKNTKKKQLLAEQDKELETQKLATVLKEQELISIDAMISGQEKERQRIANDLHDDLGGLMATLKLYFSTLREKQTPELFNKTSKLLDQAYHKIRTVAHARNAGVIAKQGLLKAVENMAQKISEANKTKIDVKDYGLDERLENSLELTIFRIIQELTTNIIKHANATEATIHLTNHQDIFNIMVEDNGEGFKTSDIPLKNGMGIHSIDKRIDSLDGKMTIESEINLGTTIIIDIPL